MIIGACQLTFHLPGNRTLKGKRQIVRRICERTRHKFHVSIAEVDDQEHHQHICIGVAVVGNDARLLQSMLDQITQFIEQMQLAHLLDKQVEIVHYDKSFAQDRPLMADDEDYYDDEYDGDEEDGVPDAPWAESPTANNNAWAFLDEWEDKKKRKPR